MNHIFHKVKDASHSTSVQNILCDISQSTYEKPYTTVGHFLMYIMVWKTYVTVTQSEWIYGMDVPFLGVTSVIIAQKEFIFIILISYLKLCV